MIVKTLIRSFLMMLIMGAEKTKTTKKDSTEEAKLFELHLRLHRNHCGDTIVACDFHKDSSESLPDYNRPDLCCLPCPCLHSCSRKHICCPEFGLHNDNEYYLEEHRRMSTTAKHDVISTNTLQTTADITEDYQTVDQQLQSDLHNATDDGNPLQNETEHELTHSATRVPFFPQAKCTRPQVFDKLGLYIDSQAYMIVDCFQSVEMAHECYTSTEEMDISDMTPITSKRTGLTYLNKYCFRCNEGDTINETVAELWDVVIVHKRNDHSYRFLLNPYELIDSMKIAYRGFTNIHFVPKTRTLAQKCELYDIISCNQTGLWEKYDENIEKVCHNDHSLPIIYRTHKGKKRFKNIACVYCNTGGSLNSGTQVLCRSSVMTTKSFTETLNLRFEDIDEESLERRENQHRLETQLAIVSQLSTGGCPTGYIALLGRCRRVICPRDYYMQNNKCVPLYISTTGLDINLKLQISLKNRIPKESAANAVSELRKIVSTSLAERVTLESREISVWYGPKGAKASDQYYMFDIFLFNASGIINFGTSMTEIHAFYQHLKSYERIGLNGGEIKIEININPRIIPKHDKYYDMSVSNDGSLTFLFGRTLEEVGNRPSRLVSNVNWCKRVPFDIKDEVEIITKGIYLINSTSMVVFANQCDEHYLFSPKLRLLFLCLDLFLSHTDDDVTDKTDITDDKLSALNSNTDDDNEATILSNPVHIAIVTGCLCIAVVGVLYKIRYTSTQPVGETSKEESPDLGVVSDVGMSEVAAQYIETENL